ncbi:MAG: hypothetical protein AAGA73_17985 [Pseudomonadota bacterium]
MVALPFIVVGVYFYVELSEAGVSLFLTTLLLITLPLRRWLKGRRVQMPRSSLAIIAVPYGFLSGASFGVGMILGPFLLGAGIAGESLVATVAVNGILLNLIKTLAFGLSPLLTMELMLIAIELGICTIPGHHLGRYVLRQTPVCIHTLFLEGIVLFGAVYFLSKGHL